MKNLIDTQEQYKSGIIEYKFSEKFTVYKILYKGKFVKKNFLKRIKENENIYFYDKDKKNNSILLSIECEEFNEIDDIVLNFFSFYLCKSTKRYVKSSWIYTQNKNFSMDWMHSHEYVFSSNKSNLITDWTYVMYIQIPPDLKNREGDIIFKNEKNVLYRYTPNENEILIFPGKLEHMAMPTKNSDIERIVYATNISFDLLNIDLSKRVQFNEIIYK